MADLSLADLEKAVKDILKDADLGSLSTKKVRKMLEEKFETDLLSRKKEIDKLVMRLITETMEKEEEAKPVKEEVKEEAKEEKEEEGKNGVSDDDSDEGLSEEEKVPKKKSKSSDTKSNAAKAGTKRKSAGKADDSEDPVMASIKEMGDEDLAKRLQEEESGLRTRGARRAAANPPKPKKRKEVDPNRKKTSAYNRPCKLSDEFAAIMGTHEMPRPEIVKAMWALVKEKNLQDPDNKQYILCDDALSNLFGAKRIKAFGMMKYLKKHIFNPE